MPWTAQLLLLLTGALAGLAAGFLGIGGGAVLTPLCLVIYPLLYPLLGVENSELVRVIFGTNMALIAVFSLSAVTSHVKAGKIDLRTILILGIPGAFGAFAGGWFATMVSGLVLKHLFAILLMVSSVLIVVRGEAKPRLDGRPRRRIVSYWLLPVLGFFNGMLGSFLGIGSGVVMIPALLLLFAYPIDRVTGTSNAAIIFIGFAGMLAYMWQGAGAPDLPGWSTGYVWWWAALPLALGGVPMARLGAWLNTRMHDRTLARVFGAAFLIIAVRLLMG